jgi:hypothetical protein
MITSESFSFEHLHMIRQQYEVDGNVLERNVFALALLQALVLVEMPFVFKGGTSLLLLLKNPRRLSTDIDLIVEPGTDVEMYLHKAAKIFPFKTMEQHHRSGKSRIQKSHYKFTYDSQAHRGTFYVLLDILFESNPYPSIVSRLINHPFLLTEEPYLQVKIPSVNSILGDKLAAFAPHTTGILLSEGKPLDIAKQFFDVATLIDEHDSLEEVIISYESHVASQLAYRGLTVPKEEVLSDTINAAVSIASRGLYNPEEYLIYLTEIKGIARHIYSGSLNPNTAVLPACKIMYFAACLLNGELFEIPQKLSKYTSRNIGNTSFSKLSSVRKLSPEGFAYVVKAIDILEK